KADGHTPMCGAFQLARDSVSGWTDQHPDAFPPTVINITDGESTDGDPSNIAREITSIVTPDGPVLLFNCHISASGADSKLFPSTPEGLPGREAELLFNISDVFPAKHLELARSAGIAV